MRLNKFIASCGICSRREADKLIADGRITVNGINPSQGQDINDSDTVCLDDKVIKPLSEHIYLAYYKPVGVVCTKNDKHAEKTIYDDASFPQGVTYAGRLDKDSEGLLILTDDGDLINAMMKGINGHDKEYVVTLDSSFDNEFIDKMSSGVYLKDLDRTTRKCRVKRVSDDTFNIVLTQGMNRQIRRMCSSLGKEVKRLKRIRVMSVTLSEHKLKPGEFEALTQCEIEALYKETGLK